MSDNTQWILAGQVGVDSGRLTILDHVYVDRIDEAGAPLDDAARRLVTMVSTGDGIFRVFVRRCGQTGIVRDIRILCDSEDVPEDGVAR